jgi:Solute carrier family 12
VQSGIAFERARRALLRLEEEAFHAKNWRPIILALSGSAASRRLIAAYGYWLTAGRGVLSLGQVIGGDIEDRVPRARQAERLLRQFIAEERLEAFPTIVVDEELLEGVKSLLQCYGLGGIRPNTVLLGWGDDPEHLERYSDIVRLSDRLGRNTVIVKREQLREPWDAPPGEIHIWWSGRKNGPLLLILAHLLVQNPEFRHRMVRVIHVVPHAAGQAQARAHLSAIVTRARIEAEPMVVVTENLREALMQISAQAAVVFLGFNAPEQGEHVAFFQHIEVLTEGLNDVVLVSSIGQVDLEA